jgi:hypothetical protein
MKGTAVQIDQDEGDMLPVDWSGRGIPKPKFAPPRGFRPKHPDFLMWLIFKYSIVFTVIFEFL